MPNIEHSRLFFLFKESETEKKTGKFREIECQKCRCDGGISSGLNLIDETTNIYPMLHMFEQFSCNALINECASRTFYVLLPPSPNRFVTANTQNCRWHIVYLFLWHFNMNVIDGHFILHCHLNSPIQVTKFSTNQTTNVPTQKKKQQQRRNARRYYRLRRCFGFAYN